MVRGSIGPSSRQAEISTGWPTLIDAEEHQGGTEGSLFSQLTIRVEQGPSPGSFRPQPSRRRPGPRPRRGRADFGPRIRRAVRHQDRSAHLPRIQFACRTPPSCAQVRSPGNRGRCLRRSYCSRCRQLLVMAHSRGLPPATLFIWLAAARSLIAAEGRDHNVLHQGSRKLRHGQSP